MTCLTCNADCFEQGEKGARQCSKCAAGISEIHTQVSEHYGNEDRPTWRPPRPGTAPPRSGTFEAVPSSKRPLRRRFTIR